MFIILNKRKELNSLNMRIAISLLLTAFLINNLYILIGSSAELVKHKNVDQEPASFTNEVLNHRISNPAPVELGKVNWLRNFDEAIKQSQQRTKPLPRCHPLMA